MCWANSCNSFILWDNVPTDTTKLATWFLCRHPDTCTNVQDTLCTEVMSIHQTLKALKNAVRLLRKEHVHIFVAVVKVVKLTANRYPVRRIMAPLKMSKIFVADSLPFYDVKCRKKL